MDVISTLASTVIFLFAEGGQAPLGTAFIVGYPVPGERELVVPLVVTARHVVGDSKTVVGRFTAKDGGQPATVTYDLEALRGSGDLWEHPADDGVDIIVFRTAHPKTAQYEPLPLNLVASRQAFQDEEIKASDRIIFPFLLSRFMGTTRNYPITRSGTIGLIPEERVPLEYKVGTKQVQTKQEVILLDALSVSGASGAPIFLWPGPRPKRNSFDFSGTKPLLLGVMHGFYNAQERGLVPIEVNRVIPGFAENSGVAIAFPSWRLLEILQDKKVEARISAVTKTVGQ